MAGTFPSIEHPVYPFREKTIKRKIFSKFESGHELSRTTATVAKTEFELRWNALPEADYQTLRTFFISQGAESFDWTHPVTSVVYTVRFIESEMDFQIPFYGHRFGSLILHEVP